MESKATELPVGFLHSLHVREYFELHSCHIGSHSTVICVTFVPRQIYLRDRLLLTLRSGEEISLATVLDGWRRPRDHFCNAVKNNLNRSIKFITAEL